MERLATSVQEFPTIHNRSACDSPRSCQTSSYSIECPVDEFIALQKISYGAKPYTPNCPNNNICTNRQHCCRYETGDCLISLNDTELAPVYKDCSHTPQCGWLFASSIPLQRECKIRDRSNYIWAEFQCISKDLFIDMCSQHYVTAKSVNIHHATMLSPYNAQQCSCIVTPEVCNTSADIEFYAIDVRLHSGFEDLRNCSTSSRIELVGQNEVKQYGCTPNKFQHGMQLFYKTSEQNVIMYLHKMPRQFPQKVWLHVKASLSSVKLKVTCGARSVETAHRCPARPRIDPGNDMKVLPDRTANPPTVIHLDEDYLDPNKGGGGNTEGDLPGEQQNPAIAAIIGGIAAGVVVLLLMLIVICLIIRRRQRNKKNQQTPDVKASLSLGEESHPLNFYEPIGDESKYSRNGANNGNLIYHEPWGGQQGTDVGNRLQKKDLAYATSEEIKVLIEKMEQDRHKIVEGSSDYYPSPDPTYYRHISTFTFKPHGSKQASKEDDEEEEENDRPRTKDGDSDSNCGTDKQESEDSKVEADRGIDWDLESPLVESETVSAYCDGYESPRVSSCQPSESTSVRTSVRSSVKSEDVSELPNYVYEPDSVILEDQFADLEVPDEPAPPVSAAILSRLKEKRKSGELTERKEGEIILGAYREPKGSVENITRETTRDCTEDSQSDHPYSPVYDEISDKQTKL
ncbi:uncharacterized protein LOC127866172 isoform X2 [Dreissena polymorpha]|uniref:uncharacterized protein LOC127866172 isoform X2 n=1 Tax=Dreissena polymorpha TaxID=45954 RepID=UPI0022648E49|nr:uncharacterized protein LOC127866172 isoform X2 [Dreissena polymorpha]